jgi:alpha-tubulin suppressor-like RCC1 family protein
MNTKLIWTIVRLIMVPSLVALVGCGGGGGGSDPIPSANSALSASISSPSGDVIINKDGSVDFQSTVSGGTAPYTYHWAFGGNIADSMVEDPGSITFNTAGSYTVSLNVTDHNGATASSSVMVTVNIAGDVTPPTVTSTFPVDNTSGVASNTVISAGFSENIDPSSITPVTFKVSSGGGSVTGTVRGSGSTTSFTPSTLLSPGTIYTATITTGVKDLAGNYLASIKTWTFTTPPVIVSGGINHTIALKGNGSLWAWGLNSDGQLGDTTNNNSSTPVPIGVGSNWISIAAGAHHTAAIRADGTLWSWGKNDLGQLGDGTGEYNNNSSPIQEYTESQWVAVAAGIDFTVAIKSDGTLWAWGDNTYGQLGKDPNVTHIFDSDEPIQVSSSHEWATISAGEVHCLAIKRDGSLWAWGSNEYGQLGNEDGTIQKSSTPVQVGTNTDWTVIAAVGLHSLAIKNDGTLYAWGDNSFGQLGRDTAASVMSVTPLKVNNDTDWTAVAGGYTHSIALKNNGELWVWGNNTYGQLGNGSCDSQNPLYSHVQIGLGSDKCVGVYSGARHSFAIKSGSSNLWAWGNDVYGQLGNGTSGALNYINALTQSIFNW